VGGDRGEQRRGQHGEHQRPGHDPGFPRHQVADDDAGEDRVRQRVGQERQPAQQDGHADHPGQRTEQQRLGQCPLHERERERLDEQSVQHAIP
jgi:hypothetical protein